MLALLLIVLTVLAFLIVAPLNNFSRGDLTAVKFQPTSANGQNPKVLRSINVTAHTVDREVLLFEVTHTGNQGQGTGRIAGKSDSSGTISLDFDQDDPPYLTGNNIAGQQGVSFLEGQSGILQDFFSLTQATQIPMILGKCHYEMAIGSQVKCTFDWKENINAGVKVYPTT